MPSELDQRFQKFMSSLPGAESLDKVLAGSKFDGQRRADYLLFDRRVIVELKSLEVDTSPKVNRELDLHRDREDFPLIYGDVELHKVLKHLPDGDKINSRIFNSTTRSVEDAARSAEEQIKNTADLLGLHEAVGLLVLLNQEVDILAPNAVVGRLSPLMCRTDEARRPKSPIAFSWLVFESHSVAKGPAPVNMPVILLEGPRSAEYPWFSAMFEHLQSRWAAFNGRPLVRKAAKSLEELSITPTAASKEADALQGTTKQEFWESRYAARPYLRPLTDEQVLARGSVAVQALQPYFMVGGPRIPLEQLEPLMVAWSDFLCEGRHRGLDLRKMPKA